jgi:hypothetical protein
MGQAANKGLPSRHICGDIAALELRDLPAEFQIGADRVLTRTTGN